MGLGASSTCWLTGISTSTVGSTYAHEAVIYYARIALWFCSRLTTVDPRVAPRRRTRLCRLCSVAVLARAVVCVSPLYARATTLASCKCIHIARRQPSESVIPLDPDGSMSTPALSLRLLRQTNNQFLHLLSSNILVVPSASGRYLPKSPIPFPKSSSYACGPPRFPYASTTILPLPSSAHTFPLRTGGERHGRRWND
ncbi:hypothetical protein BDV93DRAFT_522433 [Ceratobasidium sp. AG-I]|nr:hypothetical protein BDV93DRAFT_522433 [Ceratobasidium sp. AG-I]